MAKKRLLEKKDTKKKDTAAPGMGNDMVNFGNDFGGAFNDAITWGLSAFKASKKGLTASYPLTKVKPSKKAPKSSATPSRRRP